MNEFEAAMGLCVLDDIENIKSKRKDIYEIYQRELKGIVQFQEQNEHATQNYSYFPIVLKSEEQFKTIKKDSMNKIFSTKIFLSFS